MLANKGQIIFHCLQKSMEQHLKGGDSQFVPKSFQIKVSKKTFILKGTKCWNSPSTPAKQGPSTYFLLFTLMLSLFLEGIQYIGRKIDIFAKAIYNIIQLMSINVYLSRIFIRKNFTAPSLKSCNYLFTSIKILFEHKHLD